MNWNALKMPYIKMPYIIYLSNPYNYTNYASYNVGDIMEIDEKKLNLIEIVLRAYDP